MFHFARFFSTSSTPGAGSPPCSSPPSSPPLAASALRQTTQREVFFKKRNIYICETLYYVLKKPGDGTISVRNSQIRVEGTYDVRSETLSRLPENNLKSFFSPREIRSCAASPSSPTPRPPASSWSCWGTVIFKLCKNRQLPSYKFKSNHSPFFSPSPRRQLLALGHGLRDLRLRLLLHGGPARGAAPGQRLGAHQGAGSARGGGAEGAGGLQEEGHRHIADGEDKAGGDTKNPK